MTEYGFLQVLQALSYFKCVSGSTGFRGSTFGAFEGLFEEVAACDDADGVGGIVCWTVCWNVCLTVCWTVLIQCDRCDDEFVSY